MNVEFKFINAHVFQICIPVLWAVSHWLLIVVDLLKHKILILDSQRDSNTLTEKKTLTDIVVGHL